MTMATSALIGLTILTATPTPPPSPPETTAGSLSKWLASVRPSPTLAAHLSALGPFATGSIVGGGAAILCFGNPNIGGNVITSAVYTAAPLGLGLGHLYAGDLHRAFDVSTWGLGASAMGMGLGTAVDWAVGLSCLGIPPMFAGLGQMAGLYGYGAWAVSDAYRLAAQRRALFDRTLKGLQQDR